MTASDDLDALAQKLAGVNRMMDDVANLNLGRSEADEEHQCDRLVQSLGGDVQRHSQRRASHVTEGSRIECSTSSAAA